MESRWYAADAEKCANDPLKLRVYTSRLLGQESNLVLHGGGNTSVKTTNTDLFGDDIDVLCVKGSGWDLATIEAAGFPAVKMQVLKKLAELPSLSDADMVNAQRAALLDPHAPTPSVEAILHAIIPFAFVDHTHADAVVTISNTPDGAQRIQEIYGDKILVIPYIMPGFVLAKKVREFTEGIDWNQYQGIILLNHGVFSFADDAKTSYLRMIEIVTKAENYITQHCNSNSDNSTNNNNIDLIVLADLRRHVSLLRGQAMIALLNQSQQAKQYSALSDIKDISSRGPLTPDHVLRTKRIPMIITDNIQQDVNDYADDYQRYFETYNNQDLTCLDPAPRTAIWPHIGTVSFGDNLTSANIVADISKHTHSAIQTAEQLGGWQALNAKDIFEVEYWELEQAKLGKNKQYPQFQGKIVLITGAASGIGKACVDDFYQQGAIVIALDIVDSITTQFVQPEIVGLQCDVTNEQSLIDSIEYAVTEFGGLDILICNAGVFPASETLDKLNKESWQKSLDCNLTSNQQLLKAALPYLKLGIDPAIVIIASKNVMAPGPGAAAYSVAKAGLTQLARVAALEFSQWNIRVNVVHPNAVFDTGIWTDEVLQQRAHHYAMSVNQYKSNNLLKVEVKSTDVAKLVSTVAGRAFAKTTGAQIAIDGGNERVI